MVRCEVWARQQLATNGIATNVVATNRTDGGLLPKGAGGRKTRGQSPANSPARTKNRRSKEAYNAYQRGYMRKRRAKKAGG